MYEQTMVHTYQSEQMDDIEEVSSTVYDPLVFDTGLSSKRHKVLHQQEDEDDDFEDSENESSSGEVIDPELLDDNEYGVKAGMSSRMGKRHTGSPSGGKGGKRGPRKPLEPSLEFKNLHSEATSAFIDSDYERATALVRQAIQNNPEMFAAHSLLSEIFLAQGQKEKALAALFSGAHTRPKDPVVWLKVAKLVLDLAGDDRISALQDAIYCYSRVIDIDHKNYETRFERAAAYHELGYNGKAALDYERLLKDLPHNMEALRALAEVYVDLNEADKAKVRYEDSILYYMTLDPAFNIEFDWSDVNIYVELFGYLDDHARGISAIKFLARWMLGRQDDEDWDNVVTDDREFDANDFPRRLDVPWFVPNKYPPESYGLGLPLELRIKLGVYRLKSGIENRDEALGHFSWLEPKNQSWSSKISDYSDLFREAANTLKDCGLFSDALQYYIPLQRYQEHIDTSLLVSMAECYSACKNNEAAENCYLMTVEYDENTIEVRVKLAKFYEKFGMFEQALKYINEASELGRQEFMTKRKRPFITRIEQLANAFRSLDAQNAGINQDIEERRRSRISVQTAEGLHNSRNKVSLTTSLPSALKKRAAEARFNALGDHIQYLHTKLLELRPEMRSGEPTVTEDWLDIADALICHFRSNRVFFPVQRSMSFLGNSKDGQKKSGKLKSATILNEVQETADRLQTALGIADNEAAIPTDYHGIAFDDWLDIFLEYALVLAGQGQAEEVYDTLATAAEAIVWYRSKPSTLHIYVCWFACALRLQDEESLASTARWFMKEYQFVTDTYRLFATLSRLCGDPRKSLFHSSPSMKFMLRQIKAVDYTLPEDPSNISQAHRTRASVFHERAALTTKDETGNPIPAHDMDVALLVLYGHILYAGSSFTNALNYFFRAYALDPENPAILLSIGLSYINHALKRQSENRHYFIIQGLSFMNEYRRVREKSELPQEKQEMEFNYARVWHMLSLSHLAVEGYKRCLEMSDHVAKAKAGSGPLSAEDFTRDAAYALQSIYALSGDAAVAKEITDRWLII